MNKVLKIALGAVLSVALVAPAFAQDNFPDVPENHWAYQAMSNLKDKVLFGYPDGFVRGARMMSRYEFAVAINQLWTKMMGMFEGVDSKISAMQDQLNNMKPGGGDNGALQKQLDDLKNQVDGMKGWGSSISDLQKLSGEFEKELASLGVDVDAMKKDMADVKSRLTALENKSNAVNIGASVDMLILAGHSKDGMFGLLPDGTIVGRNDFGGLNHPTGFTRDFKVVHNVDLNLSGGTDSGVKWNADLGIGNTFGTFGDLNTNSANAGGAPFGDRANTDVVFNTMYVTYNSELVGQGVGVKVGRFGKQVGEYLWQRPAYSADYYQNALRDSGDWYMDGVQLDFKFGPAALQVFGGRNSNLLTTNGGEINPSVLPSDNGLAPVDATLGLQLNVPIGETGDVTLAYLWQDSFSQDTIGASQVNRRNVYGADANLMFNNIKFHGSFAQTDISYNTSNVVNSDNTAWSAGLGFKAAGFDIDAGYRRVEKNFAADGAWGRFGTLWNPTNFEGFNVGVSFNPSADLHVYGKGEFVEAIDAGAGGWAVADNDKVNTYTIGLGYKLSNAFDLGLKYENATFDYNTGTDPALNWYTVALGYNLDTNAKLMFTYIYSDADYKGRTIGTMAGQYKGGLLGTQLSVKF